MQEIAMFLWRQITPTLLAAGFKALVGRSQAAVPEAPPLPAPLAVPPAGRPVPLRPAE